MCTCCTCTCTCACTYVTCPCPRPCPCPYPCPCPFPCPSPCPCPCPCCALCTCAHLSACLLLSPPLRAFVHRQVRGGENVAESIATTGGAGGDTAAGTAAAAVAATTGGGDSRGGGTRGHRRSLSGTLLETAEGLHRRTFSGGAPPIKVDIRYKDEVELSFGDVSEDSGLNVLDHIPEVGAVWRLWVRAISIDITVPPDQPVVPPSQRPRRWKRTGAAAGPAPAHRDSVGSRSEQPTAMSSLSSHQSFASPHQSFSSPHPSLSSEASTDHLPPVGSLSPTAHASSSSGAAAACAGSMQASLGSTDSLPPLPDSTGVDGSDGGASGGGGAGSGVKTISVDWEEASAVRRWRSRIHREAPCTLHPAPCTLA